jgi:RNA-binding protein Musashi
VGGLSWQTTEESLSFHFQRYGAVASVELMKDRATGKPRGFGFVTFADPATVDLVMQDSHEVCHKLVDVKRAQARGVAPPSIHQQQQPYQPQPQQQQQQQQPYQMQQQLQPPPPGAAGEGAAAPAAGAGVGARPAQELTPEQMHCKVFVGGIPHSVDRDELRRILSEFGAVTDSIVMLDQLTQRSRGFGFVTFADPAGAERAIAAQPLNVQGRHVEIKLATPRPDRFAAGGDGPSSVASSLPPSGGGYAGGPNGGAAAGPPFGRPAGGHGHPPSGRFLGLRAGQQQLSSSSANSEYAGLAVAYGRSGWKAGFGSRAFGRNGWDVRGWDDGGEDGDKKKGEGDTGFSFSMLVGEEGEDDEDDDDDEDESPPAKRRRQSEQG